MFMFGCNNKVLHCEAIESKRIDRKFEVMIRFNFKHRGDLRTIKEVIIDELIILVGGLNSFMKSGTLADGDEGDQ